MGIPDGLGDGAAAERLGELGAASEARGKKVGGLFATSGFEEGTFWAGPKAASEVCGAEAVPDRLGDGANADGFRGVGAA